MPIIHIEMFEGRSIEQKRNLVVSMTDAVVKSIGAKPDTVRIIITELSKQNMSIAGVLQSDKND